MKKIIVISLVIFSALAFAHSEHKRGLEERPTKEHLTFYRGCFDEIEHLGCGHPRDGQEIFNSCLHEKHNELTQACRKFFETLYGKERATKKNSNLAR